MNDQIQLLSLMVSIYSYLMLIMMHYMLLIFLLNLLLMKTLLYVKKYFIIHQPYLQKNHFVIKFMHIMENLSHQIQIYVLIDHPLDQILHYVKLSFLSYLENINLFIYNLANILQCLLYLNNKISIMLFFLMKIYDLYYILSYKENQ